MPRPGAHSALFPQGSVFPWDTDGQQLDIKDGKWNCPVASVGFQVGIFSYGPSDIAPCRERTQ